MALQRYSKAAATRDKILEVTGEEMVRVGYRAMGLSDILDKLNMSKGALYHHFKNKLELGYAVLDELYAKRFSCTWDSPLEKENPLQATIDCLEAMPEQVEAEMLRCGCPINNLAIEMSPIDEGFRLRVEQVYKHWRTRLTEAFLRAQKQGMMRQDVDVDSAVTLMIVSVQGAFTLAKNSQDNELFEQSLTALAQYLRSLRTITEH